MVKKDPRFDHNEYHTYMRIFRLLEGQSYAGARKLAKGRKIDPDVIHMNAGPRG